MLHTPLHQSLLSCSQLFSGMLEPSAQSGSNLLAMLLQHRGDDDADDDHGFPSPEVPTADLLGIEDPSDGSRQDAAIKRTLSRAKQAAVRVRMCKGIRLAEPAQQTHCCCATPMPTTPDSMHLPHGVQQLVLRITDLS